MSKRSDAVKNWRKNTKRKLILAFGGVCARCGYNKCDDVFEFHHVDPNQKEFTWSSVRGNIKSFRTILEEMKKCVMLCSNCHKEYHAGLFDITTDMVTLSDDVIAELISNNSALIPKDACPICGTGKPTWHQTCSRACAFKWSPGRKIDWTKYDVTHMVQTMSITKIAEVIGCSPGAVSIRIKKLKRDSIISSTIIIAS